jgi:hypothetical protein
MTEPTAKNHGRSFSLAVFAWVLSAFVVIGALLVYFVFWSASEVDEAGLNRQTQRIAHAIETERGQLPREQKGVSIWTEALNAVRTDDLAWLDKFLAGRYVLVLRPRTRGISDDRGAAPARSGGICPRTTPCE